MERDVLEQTRDKVIKKLISEVKRCTYLEGDSAEALAKGINTCIATYLSDYIKSVNLRKYCIEQAARVPGRDLLETAKRIEEYIKEEV